MRNLLLFLFCLQFNPYGLFAQWESVSSGMPSITNTIVASDGINSIYGLNYHGLYKSTNECKKWLKTPLNDSSNYSCLLVEGNNILAGGYGLYYSNDGGNTFLTRVGQNRMVSSLAKSSDFLFAIMGHSIIRSTNFGQTWIDTTYIDNGEPSKLVTHNSTVILGYSPGAYSGTGGLYYSTNLGDSWNQSNLTSFDCMNLCSNGNVTLASNDNELYTSFNGVSWSQISFSLPTGFYIYNISSVNEDFYITAFSNYESIIFKSFNNGNNWIEIPGAENSHIVSMTKINSKIVAGTEYRGVLFSEDNGIKWNQYLPSDIPIGSLFRSGNRLFAGTSNFGIYYSDDLGENWIQSNLREKTILSFTQLDSFLFAGAYTIHTDTGGVLRSSDNGLNWDLTSLRNRTINSVTSHNNFILAGDAYIGIKMSSNYGLDWSGWGLPSSITYCFEEFNGKLFAGNYSIGIYYTTNSGSTWEPTSLNNRSVRDMGHTSTHIYAATSSTNNDPGLYISSDGGLNWQLTNFPYSLNNVETYDNYIIVCSPSGGIGISTDYGATWRYKNEGLIHNNITKLLIVNNQILGGSTSGIYRTEIDYLTDLEPIPIQIPSEYSLSQNYPNPFNPSTKINFDIPRQGIVSIKIYDLLGKEIKTLVSDELNAGSYSVDFDASGLPSGTYFYRLSGDGYFEVKRMVLLK